MKRTLALALLLGLLAATNVAAAAQVSAPGDAASSGSDKGSRLGRRQHKPLDESKDQVPAGSTAKCNDGSYSTDKNRKTACSANGGIAKWLQGGS